MLKTLFSFLFAFILTGLTLTPTIMNVLDYDYEISIYFDGDEEEKEGNEGKESAKEKELKIYQEFLYSFCFNDDSSSHKLGFYSNLYASSFKELISPPPEQV